MSCWEATPSFYPESAERDVVGHADTVPCRRNAQVHRLFNPFPQDPQLRTTRRG